MTIIGGTADDAAPTGLSKWLAAAIKAAFPGTLYTAGGIGVKGLDAMAKGIADALDNDKVGAAQVAGGGGGGTSVSSFTTATPRRYGLWHTAEPIAGASWVNLTAGVQAPIAWGGGGRATQLGTDRHWLQFNFPSVLGNVNGYLTPNNTAAIGYPLSCPKLTTRVRLQTLVNGGFGMQFWNTAGSGEYSAAYVPVLGGSNSDSGVFIGMAYDPRVSANFIFGSGAGTLATWIDTGVAASTTTDFTISIETTDSGTTWKCTIINVNSGVTTTVTKSTGLPSNIVPLQMAVGALSLATTGLLAGNGPWVEYLHWEYN